MKRTSSALLLLLAVATGARVIYALLMPVMSLLIYGLVLIAVYAVALGFGRRL